MKLVAGVVLEDEEEAAALSVSITVFVDSLVSLSVQDNHPMITMIIEVSQQSVYKQYKLCTYYTRYNTISQAH